MTDIIFYIIKKAKLTCGIFGNSRRASPWTVRVVWSNEKAGFFVDAHSTDPNFKARNELTAACTHNQSNKHLLTQPVRKNMYGTSKNVAKRDFQSFEIMIRSKWQKPLPPNRPEISEFMHQLAVSLREKHGNDTLSPPCR